MNRDSEESEVAEENELALHPHPTNYPFATYADIQKYETQKSATLVSASYNMPIHHEGCKPFYLAWASTMPQPPPCIELARTPLLEWIIDRDISLCCFDLKLQIQLRVRKNGIIEVLKYRRNGNLFDEEGIKYVIENKVSTVGVKICIVKDGQSKVWKQIEAPTSSYQSEAQCNISISEKADGDVCITVNSFELMMSLRKMHMPGLLVGFRLSGTSLQGFTLEQIKQSSGNESVGCVQDKCALF